MSPVSPDSTKIVEPLENFDVVWTIKNVSDQIWDVNEVDYKWLSGVEMQIYANVFDIPQTVQPDETITLIVDVRAPDTTGTYTTQWALVNGRIILCHLPLTVNVKEINRSVFFRNIKNFISVLKCSMNFLRTDLCGDKFHTLFRLNNRLFHQRRNDINQKL